MLYKDIKAIFEKQEDQSGTKLYKFCSFEWILDLLKDGVVFSYEKNQNINRNPGEKGSENEWIALTSKRSSLFNNIQPEYGTCEVVIDRRLLETTNTVYNVSFTPSWLDKRPSICKFVTGGKYSNSKEYFIENAKTIDWSNTDNFSKKFFSNYLVDTELDFDSLFEDHDLENIEDYIYDLKYISFKKYLSNLGGENEVVIVQSPLKLVNDAITLIVCPRRYKEKIQQFESDYKIRYE